MNYYINALTKNYGNFNGRARRKEYWTFVLCNVIVGFVLGIIAAITKISIIPGIYYLIVLVPSVALMVRRLHDIGKSGAWFFISFIPVVGAIWLLVLTCMEGGLGSNQYGENPKAVHSHNQ